MPSTKSCFHYFLYAVIAFFPHFLNGSEQAPFATLEEEYTSKYCLQLEAAYGEGMMSEGGAEGIEHMFDQVALHGKTALDIGCGLGGVAFYLSEKYGMRVTGIEVNPWMVEEAHNRTPEHLKGKVDFLLTTRNSNWAIPSGSCDMIYSKGVLTHLESKDEIFQEFHRLLNDEGLVVITDWLSSDERKWGPNIAKLVELENLALYPETVGGYIALLEKSGFTVLSVRNDSSLYHRFNQEIAARLQGLTRVNLFDAQELEDAVVGYLSIAKAIETKELRVYRFIAQKSGSRL